MKHLKLCTVLMTTIFLLVQPQAHAQNTQGGDEGLYVKAFGGLSFPSFGKPRYNGIRTGIKPETKTGYGFGGAVGYSYGYGLSGEVEILWQTGDINRTGLTDAGLAETGSVASLMAFANAVYKFENIGSGKIRPYVGAGFAYIEEIDSDLMLVGGQAAEFSAGSGVGWQVKAGVDIKLSEDWSVDAGARYINAGRTSMTGDAGTLNISYSTWMTTFGITKRF